MAITAAMVKELREKTGAGMMDCKKALTATNGDAKAAIDWLREKGISKAEKKASRIAAEGAVAAYITDDAKVGVLVEVSCDEAAKDNDAVKEFAHDLALQIAAAKPEAVRREEVDATKLEKEKEIQRAKALEAGKPEKIVDRIVEGQIEKYYKEVCLLDQQFVKDGDKTIKGLMAEVAKAAGCTLDIVRFARFERGEGIEKRQDNLAEEIAKMTNA